MRTTASVATAQATKTATLKARSPAGTAKPPASKAAARSRPEAASGRWCASQAAVRPLTAQYAEAMVHGRPRPRKTFTELLPVMLPIALSAFSSSCAAILDANVSGKLVPRATSVMAVVAGDMPRQQPKSSAMSPMMTVTKPIINNATEKQSQPPAYSVGGTTENKTFHGIATMCAPNSGQLLSFCADRLPPQKTEETICSL
mmetsp:Transcript_59978/g.168083  ORF Transcript_59978/g.168083 Transcript_59978/m.168083 type:complete len:202 (+) Transcript_59978:641-1246(+)